MSHRVVSRFALPGAALFLATAALAQTSGGNANNLSFYLTSTGADPDAAGDLNLRVGGQVVGTMTLSGGDNARGTLERPRPSSHPETAAPPPAQEADPGEAGAGLFL